MKINPNVEIYIQKYLQKYLMCKGVCSIKELIQNYSSSIPTTEAELRNAINNALKLGHIKIIDRKIPRDESTVRLSKPFLFNCSEGNFYIVISKPRMRELSLGGIEERNNQIDSIDCFREIISSARRILRICSPFIQKNVLSEDSFPDLKELLIDALERNVNIRLLSRELFQGRGEEVQWLINIAQDLDKEKNLTIVDYHLSSEQGNVLSSTHAKLLIADYDKAYVGSAELRRNSLVANFEVGCLLTGPQVIGICEVFDFMLSRGSVWK